MLPSRPFARVSASVLIALLLAVSVIAALRVGVASAQTFTPGTQARVTADGDSLRMRSGATVSAAIIASIPDGSIVNIREGSQLGDGYTWQLVEWGGAIGWVASEYLTPLQVGSTPTPSPTTVIPTPTPSPTVTPVPPAAGVALGTISGNLPPAGKAGLIAWGGGSMDSLVATALGRGCNIGSVYALKDGRFIGYSPSAPAFVNAAWVSQIGELNSLSAVLVSCVGPSQTAAAPAPAAPSTPTGAGGGSVAAPAPGGPPGPGGNQ